MFVKIVKRRVFLGKIRNNFSGQDFDIRIDLVLSDGTYRGRGSFS